MRVNVRCRCCNARRVLTKHPDLYIRLPKCKTCKAQNYRVVIREKQITCYKDCFAFPHRKGSHPNCNLPVIDFMKDLLS